MEWPRSISQEEMASLPIQRFVGELHLVATPEDLERESAAMLRERVVGFDTETRPAFRKGDSYLPSLVQVAGERVAWILRLDGVDGSPVRGSLLSAPEIVKDG